MLGRNFLLLVVLLAVLLSVALAGMNGCVEGKSAFRLLQSKSKQLRKLNEASSELNMLIDAVSDVTGNVDVTQYLTSNRETVKEMSSIKKTLQLEVSALQKKCIAGEGLECTNARKWKCIIEGNNTNYEVLFHTPIVNGVLYKVWKRDVVYFDKFNSVWVPVKVSGTQPNTRYAHMTVGYKNQILMFGGADDISGVTHYDEMWSFNTLNSTWTMLSKTGSPVRRGSISRIGDVLYVFGGTNSTQVGDLFLKYDIPNNKWTKIETNPGSPKPSARFRHWSAVLDGIIYMYGGMDKKKALLDDLWSYDPSTNVWSVVKPLSKVNPPPTQQHTLVELNGQLVLQDKSDIWFFDVQTKIWTKKTTFGSTNLSSGLAAAVLDNHIYYSGGKKEGELWRL